MIFTDTHAETKHCRGCDRTLAPSDFHKSRRERDGLQPRCKDCQRTTNREARRANPERANAYARAWRAANPERSAEHSRQDYERHREKYMARLCVCRALRDGRLVKPDACQDCGAAPPSAQLLHGHHGDYAKPLEVEWLCPRCHAGRHMEDAA